VLGYRIASDPRFALATAVLRQIEDVASPDAQTVVVTWRNTFIFANDMGLNTVVPVPRHKLAALYDAGDEQGLASSPFWADQWVGLGPYKMASWERGSQIELLANDDYFLGRPKIDRIIIRYYGDTRALIVAILAGEIDVVPVGSMKTEEAAVLRNQWEAAGNGKVVLSFNKLGNGWFQYRDPSAPWIDARVRRAMVLLLDRQSMVETLHNGLSEVDDVFFLRDDPAYKLAQLRGLPDLRFDPNRAHQLLAQAGFTRGSADSVYRSEAGAPFRLEMAPASDINSDVQTMFVVSDSWKQAGIESEHQMITPTTDRPALRAQLKGVALISTTQGVDSLTSLVTSEINSEATRWRGANVGGHSNPAYDEMHKRVFSTINPAERDDLVADMIRFSLENTLYLPLTYSPDVSANRSVVSGVTSTVPSQRVNAWNVHLWELN
jgi:ABC-type transport system substrate-binding protein